METGCHGILVIQHQKLCTKWEHRLEQVRGHSGENGQDKTLSPQSSHPSPGVQPAGSASWGAAETRQTPGIPKGVRRPFTSAL